METNKNSLLEVKLKKLEKDTNCPIHRVNAQRILGPPANWNGEIPSRGSEVYVANIPRDMYEDELYPLFSKIGTIYKLRLMLEFSGANRGFAFVTYSNPEEAGMAVAQLNKFQVARGVQLFLCISVDNCRLLVSNLPSDKDAEEIYEDFKQIMDGLQSVVLYSGNGANDAFFRRFAYLAFDSHQNAMEVRRKFWYNKLLYGDMRVFIDWAIPEKFQDEYKKVVIRGLHPGIDNISLASAIYRKLQFATIFGLEITENEAVVTFSSHTSVVDAYKTLKGITVKGHKLYVTFDRTQDYYNDDRQMSTPETSENEPEPSTSSASSELTRSTSGQYSQLPYLPVYRCWNPHCWCNRKPPLAFYGKFIPIVYLSPFIPGCYYCRSPVPNFNYNRPPQSQQELPLCSNGNNCNFCSRFLPPLRVRN